MKLRKGDEVKIIKGKDKGKIGKIEKVLPKEQKVLIPGVNVAKRHLKARSTRQPSEIVSVAKPIAIANVMLICPKCNLPTRVGYSLQNDKQARICKKCEQLL